MPYPVSSYYSLLVLNLVRNVLSAQLPKEAILYTLLNQTALYSYYICQLQTLQFAPFSNCAYNTNNILY